MAITRQTVLKAIDSECAAQRGPTPVWLVPIAANARSAADRHAVDQMLIEMRTEGLLAYVKSAPRGRGVVLTDAGRDLAYPKAEKINTPPSSACSNPRSSPLPRRPVCAPASVPSAPPVTPVAPEPDAPEPLSEADDDLAALLCELGHLVAERLEAALDDNDMRAAIRLSELSDRLLTHTRKLLP